MYSLYMVILGGKPKGRHTEQHDVFFGIANSLTDLIPAMKKHWGEANFHIDAWRRVTKVDGHGIQILERRSTDTTPSDNPNRLYFINLGGYKQNDMEEYHYKLLTVASNTSEAIQQAKQTAFYKHTGFGKKAVSHIDDKFGIDVDDFYLITDILTEEDKRNFYLHIHPDDSSPEDELEIGYLKIGV